MQGHPPTNPHIDSHTPDPPNRRSTKPPPPPPAGSPPPRRPQNTVTPTCQHADAPTHQCVALPVHAITNTHCRCSAGLRECVRACVCVSAGHCCRARSNACCTHPLPQTGSTVLRVSQAQPPPFTLQQWKVFSTAPMHCINKLASWRDAAVFTTAVELCAPRRFSPAGRAGMLHHCQQPALRQCTAMHRAALCCTTLQYHSAPRQQCTVPGTMLL